MELNTYRLNSLEEPTDAQLHALMEQVAMSARESSGQRIFLVGKLSFKRIA